MEGSPSTTRRTSCVKRAVVAGRWTRCMSGWSIPIPPTGSIDISGARHETLAIEAYFPDFAGYGWALSGDVFRRGIAAGAVDRPVGQTRKLALHQGTGAFPSAWDPAHRDGRLRRLARAAIPSRDQQSI